MSSTEKCIHCKRSRGNHKAKTENCPIGAATRVGYTQFHATQVFEAKRRWTTFLPKHPVCERQCATCPFRQGQKIVHRKGLREVKATVQAGFPFFCHKTVYIGDPLKGALAAEQGDDSLTRPRANWKECRGALNYRERENIKRKRLHESRVSY